MSLFLENFKLADSYNTAERWLLNELVIYPEFKPKKTHESISVGFRLCPWETDDDKDKIAFTSKRLNEEHCELFFDWIMSGDTNLSDKINKLQPYAKIFVDGTGLPENFSSSYGWKIKEQLPVVIEELKRNPDSRRAYLSILLKEDNIILGSKTSMEYPCTIVAHYFIRRGRLHAITHMRSQNVWSVMGYDVYNMCRLQEYIAQQLDCMVGDYTHHIDSAHVFTRDIKRIEEYLNSEAIIL